MQLHRREGEPLRLVHPPEVYGHRPFCLNHFITEVALVSQICVHLFLVLFQFERRGESAVADVALVTSFFYMRAQMSVQTVGSF